MTVTQSESASTLTEVMVSTAVLSILTAALFTGAGTLQKSFVALDDYATGKADQLRLSDYLAMDLRCAVGIEPEKPVGLPITLIVPDYYDSSGKPRTPHIVNHKVYYGDPAAFSRIRYTKRGASIYRQENDLPEVEIASDVADFVPEFLDLGKVVNTRITFEPRFEPVVTSSARAATLVSNTTLLRNKRKNLQ